MRLKSLSSLSTNPRPSYPSDPGREPTLTSSPETIALHSRSHHPPSLAVAQPTHSPQRVEAPYSPDRIPSTTPGEEPPRDARDSGSARSHSTHLETSSSNRP